MNPVNTTQCLFEDNGNGGVLAHAFRPAKDNTTHPANRHTDTHYDKNDDLAGDLHFDMNENWIFHQPSDAEKRAGKKYIFTTAVHELGHSLGFSHTEDKNSVMARVMSPDWDKNTTKLSENDIKIITDKYQKPKNWFVQHWQMFMLLFVCAYIIMCYKLLKPEERTDQFMTPDSSETCSSSEAEEDEKIINVIPESDHKVSVKN